jgi:hypothetical protein
MNRRVFGVLGLTLLPAAVAVAQMPNEYLDVEVARVRPEKRAEFDAVIRRMADANRRGRGDTWLAMETMYGEGNTVSFVSIRASYAEVEKGSDAFFAALRKAYTPAGADKLLREEGDYLLSSRAEIRRVRWDLSANAPTDLAAMAKLTGEGRWVRTTVVRVRPGQESTFEAQLKDLLGTLGGYNPTQAIIVSQAVAGQQGTVFYISTVRTSMAGFDSDTTPQPTGESGYDAFVKAVADSAESTETVINHFLPELSNPPEEIAAAAPEFWKGKAATAARMKSKAMKGGM